MPTRIIRVRPSASEVRLQAATLLAEWEQAHPSGSLSISPALRAAYDLFVEEALSGTQEANLEVADLREVLNGAHSIAIGRAEASGSGRALRALSEARQSSQVVGNHTERGKLLLAIQTQPDAELEMDELIDITETLQRQIGNGGEIIFGHGSVPNLPAELRIMFLLVTNGEMFHKAE